VPLCERAVSHYFTVADLQYLDPFREAEDNYEAKRREVYDAERRVDMGPMEYTILPGRHDFHAAGILMPNEPSPSNPDKEGMSTL
jgi:hypothetical protein